MKKPFCISMLLLLAFSSCKKHTSTPQYENADVQIIFDWSARNEADKVPDEMTLLIYPGNTDAPIRKEVSSNRAVVNLPMGTYQVIAVNNDSEKATLRGESTYETAEMYAIATPIRSTNLLPDIDKAIYAANAGSGMAVKGKEGNTLTLKLQAIVQKLKFEVIVELDKTIQSCSATLSGIAPAVNLSTLQPLRENPGSIPLVFTVTGSEMEGEVRVFGANPDVAGADRVSNKLLLDFSFTDGSQTTVPIDVTEAMNHLQNHEITISIKVQSNNSLELSGQVVKWESGGESHVPVEQ